MKGLQKFTPEYLEQSRKMSSDAVARFLEAFQSRGRVEGERRVEGRRPGEGTRRDGAQWALCRIVGRYW